MRKDVTGEKFGKLVALKCIGINKHRKSLWECKCECGNTTIVTINRLTCGRTKSCGCIANKYGTDARYEGKPTRLYTIWNGMKRRCMNKNNKDYFRYGGKGVSICAEWVNDFTIFHAWAMSNGYTDSLTIDRKDVNGNYEPLNCRWSTPKVQSNNRTNNVVLNFNNENNTITEWADKLNFNPESIRARLSRGWTIAETLTIPFDKSQKIKKMRAR